jgi:ribosome-associated translation inhibitor RaiA
MKIEIRTSGVTCDEELRAHVERRLGFALGRFAPAISVATVHLADENGPRGGVDLRCRILLRGRRIDGLVVEETATSATAAIDGAAERIGRSVARALDRARTLQITHPRQRREAGR